MSSSRLTLSQYVALLTFFAPITSILIVPSVQGTTPGYILSFLTLPVALWIGGRRRDTYLNTILIVVFIWLIFFVVSQLYGLYGAIRIFGTDVVLIDPSDTSIVLRGSLFTQSVYLFVVAMYGAFVFSFYTPEWDRWLCYGVAFLAFYGCYEFVFFMLFHESGDFLSNRMFGEDMGATGSAVQTMTIADVWLTRVKSLTGEPSMYAFTMMPFLFYAYAMRWRLWVRIAMTVSVVLTASTSALMASLVAIGVSAMHGRVRLRVIGYVLGVVALALILNYEFVMDLIDQMVLAKALGENFSGSDRSDTFGAMLDFWSELEPAAQIIGVGFGYVRSTDFFSTLLVNCGVLGVVGFVLLFLYPIIRLGCDTRSIALKQCLLSTMVVMLVSVPEYAYLAPWTFLAIAYREISGSVLSDKQKLAVLK